MFSTIVRHMPLISAVGGIVGGFYWMVLPDLTVIEIGAAATKKKLQYFEEDRELDDHMKNLIQDVEDKLIMKRYPLRNLACVEHFWCRSPEVITIGDVNLRKTSFIGLPVSFLYQNLEDVKISSDIGSEETELLKTSLLLSESAKKFAIASAYNKLDTYHFTIRFFSLMLAVGPFVTLDFFDSLLHKKSLFRRFSITFSVMFGWVLVFYYFNKFLKSAITYSSDSYAAGLGDDYLVGGIEYFTKALGRNQLMLELNAKRNETMMDSDGNQIYGLFEIPEPSLTSRLKWLKEKAEEKKRKLKNEIMKEE